MIFVMRILVTFITDCFGATSIEYAVVASMIAVAILAGVTNLGSAVKSNYASVSVALK
jgi:pilus assembly protein Flp/PilA